MNEKLKIKIELEALITEREGMIACNNERVNEGCAMAYGDGDFFDIADKIRNLIKELCKN